MAAVPASIGDLKALTYLSLNSTGITGTIVFTHQDTCSDCWLWFRTPRDTWEAHKLGVPGPRIV
jgi:hypothetical protein